MIKMCGKKFPLLKIKNGFLAIFVILEKITKTAKNNFFLKKQFFLAHLNHLRKQYFFIWNTFPEDKPNMV